MIASGLGDGDLVRLLEMVLPVVKFSDSRGIDVRKQLRKGLRSFAGQVDFRGEIERIDDRSGKILYALIPSPPESSAEGEGCARPEGNETEAEIQRLYDELAELARREDEPAYQRSLRRLRVLQTAEAKRMSEFFKADQPFSIDRHRRTRERSEQLLAQHEGTASSNRSRRRSHS